MASRNPKGMVVRQLQLLRHSSPWSRVILSPVVRAAVAVSGEGAASDDTAVTTIGKGAEQQQRTDPFSLRSPPNVWRGVQGAGWNFCMGTLGGPLVGLAVFISSMMDRGGAKGAALGAIEAPIYGATFWALGYTTAAMQLARGGINTITGPLRIANGARWHQAHSRWVQRSLAPDPELDALASDEALLFRAMKRDQIRKQGRNVGSAPEYYERLGVDEKATEKEIKDAYNRRVMTLHPDRNPSPDARQRFDEVTQAYKVLNDPNKRRLYDAGGEAAVERGAAAAGRPGCQNCASGSADAYMASQRSGVREVFGGEKMHGLIGDFMFRRWSRKMIDGVTYMVDEVDIINERMRRDCAVELASWIDGCPVDAVADPAAFEVWKRGVTTRLNAFKHIGVAESVLFVLGEELSNMARFAEAGRVARLTTVIFRHGPERVKDSVSKLMLIAKDSKAKRQNPAYLMDSMWTLSVPDIKVNVRDAALRVMLDESVSDAERSRRRAAVLQLSLLFAAAGKRYEGASQATLKKMQESVQESMKSKQQKQQQNNSRP